jgi:ABC-type phosphate transport system substrate-binding protein
VKSKVLDSQTLGSIWVGNIGWWNDTSIAELNSGLVLPGERIILVRANDSLGGISRSFTNAMSAFNAEFNATWQQSLTSGSTTWAKLTKITDHTIAVLPGEEQLSMVEVTITPTPIKQF